MHAQMDINLSAVVAGVLSTSLPQALPFHTCKPACTLRRQGGAQTQMDGAARARWPWTAVGTRRRSNRQRNASAMGTCRGSPHLVKILLHTTTSGPASHAAARSRSTHTRERDVCPSSGWRPFPVICGWCVA
jgi:hypothetical protein